MQFDNVYVLARDESTFASANIWKLPAQTDVTCSRVLLRLFSTPSILLISSTIWCRFWLISNPPLSESNHRKNKGENCWSAAPLPGLCTSAVDWACFVRDQVRDTGSDDVMKKPSRCWLRAVPMFFQDVFNSLVLLKTPLLPLLLEQVFLNRFSYSFSCFLLLNFSTKHCLRFLSFRLKI